MATRIYLVSPFLLVLALISCSNHSSPVNWIFGIRSLDVIDFDPGPGIDSYWYAGDADSAVVKYPNDWIWIP